MDTTVAPPGRWPPGGRGRRGGVGLAVLIGLIQVFGTQRGSVALVPEAYVLLLVGPAALPFRRMAPLAVFAVTAAALVTYGLRGLPGGPVFLAALVALFTAVRSAHPLGVLATVVLGYGVYVGVGPPNATLPDRIVGALVVGGSVAFACVLAVMAKFRTERFAEVARARAEQRRRQASEERLRIARELHDVLGHHLSLINMQASVGLHLMDSQPEQARTALTAIKQASAEALREVRTVLDTLRPQGEAAPRTPGNGLDRLGDLIADAEAAGLPVGLTVTGEERPLPSDVDRAAYRIAQEALTNVRRHAGPGAKAKICIEYAVRDVILTIDDDGVTPAEPSTVDGGGSGVPGMRERASALGGDLTAEPLPDGGFRVRARLPLREDT